MQSNTENSMVQDIGKLLATLQEIENQLPFYQEVTDDGELSPKCAARYLIKAKENSNNISHPVLGNLNDYLFEDNEQYFNKIIEFYSEKWQHISDNYENQKYFLKTFILEVGKSEEVNSCVTKYYNEHKEFLERQERSLTIFLEAFKGELSKPRHVDVFCLWNESIKNTSLRSEVEEKIIKDNFLNALYNRFCRELKLEYDWSACCKDQVIFEEHINYIRKNGALSVSYTELLSFLYGINIRLYVDDQNNIFFLRSNHNPSSQKIVYILHWNNKFVQLNIDENHLKQGEERKKKDGIYARIFSDIKSLKQKQDFDNYLQNKPFLFNKSSSEDVQYLHEEEDIEKIIKYFPAENRQELKERLEKISSQYIGRHSILHYILMRFSNDERCVSCQELYCLINMILISVIGDRKELNIFCWIVAAYPQKCWIDELVLLQLENYFKRTLTEKLKWRMYLSKIKNKDMLLLFIEKLDQHKSSVSMSTQCIEDTLSLLSKVPNDMVNLGALGLTEWPYALKEKYWIHKLSELVHWQKDDWSRASYYLLSIDNIFGSLLTEKLMKALEEEKQELRSGDLTNILYNFHIQNWNLNEETFEASGSYSKWLNKTEEKLTVDEKEKDITQLVTLLKNDSNTSEKVSENLLKIKDIVLNMKGFLINGKSVSSFTNDDIRNWAKKCQSNVGKEKEMLSVIERAILLTKNIKLRDTQKLTVLALLTNRRSTLAQVSTGEGKSLIVVAASIMKTLCGEKVSVVTSSSVLAKRDALDYQDIYNLFGINASHNCNEDIEKRKEAYSSNRVIYGDLSNFQRDYLLDTFYGKNILGDFNFNNAIVDEVDSMLLDKGNNMLYLSHDLAGLDKLEAVYIFIWQWINRPASDIEEICYAFDVESIKEVVISDLYGLVKKEEIGKLGSELTEQQKNIIWGRLIQTGMIDDQGKLLKENINDHDLNKILSSEFELYKHRICYLLTECIEREKCIHVPNNLRPFIEQHLESWIKSAITAFFMKAGEDYVVDVDKTGTSPDRNPNITILDRDTGTDQANSQWDEALHQFLQLKHGCKLSLQSLKAVFISNVSFFKLYSKLYGLTGTLGSKRERDLLREIHEVDFVTIPTAKSKQFHEEKPILCTDKFEWRNTICNEAKKIIDKEKRSILIICETVNEVETLYKAFGGKNAKKVYTYTRDYEEFDKGLETVNDKKFLGQGQVIIATNLAGRGTDIKITEELRISGGLHVCLTYLPNNIRIEDQAFGRAARNGDQGSGQLIIMNADGLAYSVSKIFDLKKHRNAEELHRISDIKTYYDNQITTEECCFKAFQGQYEQLKKDLDDKKVPSVVKDILLQSCLDKWAFWLDKNNRYLRDLTHEQNKRNLHNLLDELISQLKKLGTGYSKKVLSSHHGSSIEIIEHDSSSWISWVKENHVQMIKLGKYLSDNQKPKNALQNAIELFNEVIKEEPCFSEAARYYKAFLLFKNIDFEQKPLKPEDKIVLKELKQELMEAARLLEKHSEFAISAAGIISKIKQWNKQSIIQIYAFEEQKNSLANLYYMFSQSIDDIFGHIITPQSFRNYDIDEDLSESLYQDLLCRDILKKPRVKKNITEEELKVISYNYGVPPKELKDLLFKYEGKQIVEKEFIKSLKKDIMIPDRKIFWKLLIEGNVLSDEIKWVIVNVETLKEVDSSLLDHLTKKINQPELKKQSLELQHGEILLNAEWVWQYKNNDNIFKKDDLIKIVSKDKYIKLKKRGVISCNRKAHINQTKICSMTFPCYESITLEDFSKISITKNDAEKILEELVKQNVLEKKDSSENQAYSLKIKFDEVKQVHLPFCTVYENSVKWLLSICFTYKIALQKIESELKEENSPIQLKTNQHQRLIFELFKQQIIKPVTVADKDKELLENAVKEALNKVRLTEEDIINNVIRTLENSRSSLKVLKVPDCKLKPIIEICSQGEFANIEEVHIFFLNGLDQLLQLEEKKWTREMLFNTAVVAALGICQIVIGATIEVFSAGVMTHVGASFINEGVNDLFYAAGSLKSGYFSWEDYRKQKLESLVITAATFGIAAYFSRGSKVSRFGHKLAGPKFECGKKVAEMSGTQLIKSSGVQVGKEFSKRIIHKTIEGVAFGLANAGVDIVAENYLQGLCEKITSELLSNIEKEIEKHKISVNLEKLYKTLGEQDAKQAINDLTNSVFTERNCLDQILPYAIKIANSVTRGIADAVKKRSMTNNKLALPINIISKAVVWSDRLAHIASITMFTHNLINNLDKKIKDKLDNLEEDKRNQTKGTEENYKTFQKDVVDRWKKLLRERAGRVILQHIVSPILRDGANKLVRYVGKKMKEVYQSCKESEYFDRFEELKQEQKEFLQNKGKCDKSQIEEYHKNLLTLLAKTKDPKLFAAIVLENIPMDFTCASACPQVLYSILKTQGVLISGLTIIVEGDNGIRQEFSYEPEGAANIIIPLKLENNHFLFCEASTAENNASSGSKNNCLYEALIEAIPTLRGMVSPDEFRVKVAHTIQHDVRLQYHIQQGWHRLPISLGALGGRRPIPESTNKLNEQAEIQSPYQHSNSRGEWLFKESKDVDLREDRVLTNKESNLQRAKAYNEALKQINETLSRIGKKNISVDRSNFQTTKYDSILCTRAFGAIGIALYPVEMEATVEIWIPELKENVKYTCRIDLDNPIIESDTQGPRGPHIGYDVLRHNKQAPEGATGHILINQVENKNLPDRGRSQYSMDDCYLPRVPSTRLFFSPNKPDSYLERGNTSNINNRDDIRGRTYPEPDF